MVALSLLDAPVILLLALPTLALVILGLFLGASFARNSEIRAAQTAPKALVVAGGSAITWMAYVAMVPSGECRAGLSNGCLTLFKHEALLADNPTMAAALLVLGFAAIATWSALTSSIPALAIAALLAIVPVLLLPWSAPRGDGDGLWILAYWFIPGIAALCALLAHTARRIRAASLREPVDVQLSAKTVMLGDRLSGMAVDAVVVGLIVYWPLTSLSRSGDEAAAVLVGVLFAVSYEAVAISRFGGTLGHRLLGLKVIESSTTTVPSLARAFSRGLVVVIELLLAATVLFSVVLAIDAILVLSSGRSIGDRLTRTSVESRHGSRNPDAEALNWGTAAR